MKLLGFLFLCFEAVVCIGQSNIDVQHYSLNVVLSKDSKTISLNESIDIQLAQQTSSLSLDLMGLQKDKVGMKVISVSAPYQNLSWRQTTEHLHIDLPDQLQRGDIQLFIQLSGEPSDGLVIGVNKYGDPTFFADNWPNRARCWYACNDHPSDKATYDFIVEAPEDMLVVANGKLLSKTPKTERNALEWTFRLDVPISTKVAVIGAATMVTKEIGVVNGIPITATVYPLDSIKGFSTFSIAPAILSFFSNKIGEYPFPNLNNVQSTTRYGGMENAGCIFYDEKALNADLRSTHLVAHEIAHQWFGNTVTESDWAHLWLSEGFATYLTNVYIQYAEGEIAFLAQMAQDRKKVIRFHESFKNPLVDSLTTNLNLLLNPNAYQKGAWILHMLRHEMGDSAFFLGLRDYYATYKFRNANSLDFFRSMQLHTPKDLTHFRTQWLYRGGHPILKEVSKGNAILVLTQTQQELFSFPLEINFKDPSGNIERVEVSVKDREVSVMVPEGMRGKPWEYILDPKVRLLFEVRD